MMRRAIYILGVVAMLAGCSRNKGENNSYTYAGNSYKVVWAGYDEHENGDVRLIFSPTVPVNNAVTELQHRVEIVIPKGGWNIEFDLTTNRMREDQRWTEWMVTLFDRSAGVVLMGYETGVDEDDIVSGKLVATNGMGHKYSVTLTAKFTNGKTLAFRYDGEFKDLNAILEQSEGTGWMQLQTYGDRAPIVWGGYTVRNGVTTIVLCNTAPKRNAVFSEMMGGVFVMDIPDEWMDKWIATEPTSGYVDPAVRAPWRFRYNGFGQSQIHFGYENGSGYTGDDTVSGLIRVSRTEGRFQVELNTWFIDGTHLVGEYDGTMVDITGHKVPVTMWQ